MRTRLLALALLSALSSVAFSAQPEAFTLNSATHRPLNTVLDLSGVTLTLGPVAGNVAFGANETVAGTLGVTGALSGSSAAFTGNETVGGTLGVTGALNGSSAAFTGNETVAGTLGVTGALSGSSAAFTGNETVAGTLGVTGALSGSSAAFTGTISATFSGNGAAVTNLTPANLTGSTAYGRNLLTLADGTAAITAFGKTTLAGYGITDAQPLDSDLTAIAALATTAYGRNLLALADGTAAISVFGKTTLSGYNITDAQPLDSDLTAVAALATTAYGRNLLTLADGTAAITAFGKTTLAGYGITDAQPLDSDLTAVAALTTTAYGRNLLTLADGTAAITAFGKTTLAGYGITDAQPLDSDLTAIAALTTTSYGRALLTVADGTAAIAAFGKTTLAGYNITSGSFSGTLAVAGATTLTGALSGSSATMSGNVGIGGTVSASNLPPVFTPQQYGALGDGVNDDTSAVQSAVSAALAASNGGEVSFPAGKYKITSTINVATLKRLTLRGKGSESEILWAFDGNLFAWGNTTSFRECAVMDLMITPAATITTTNAMFYLPGGAERSTFTRVFTNPSSGSYRIGTGINMPGLVDSVTIDNCQFWYVKGSGVRIGNGSQCLITNSRLIGVLAIDGTYNGIGIDVLGGQGGFHLTDTDVIGWSTGVRIYDAGAGSNREIFLTHATIDSNGTGMDVEDSSYVSIVGTWLSASTTKNLLVGSGQPTLVMEGGTVFNSAADGVVIASGQFSLTGVRFRANAGTALKITANNPNRYVVTGCEFDINGTPWALNGNWFNFSANLSFANTNAGTVDPASTNYIMHSNHSDKAADALGTAFAEEAWTTPTLQNSWVNFGATLVPVGYYKDRGSRVFLRGMVKSGTVTPGTTLFTLPAGYRPVGTEVFPVSSNDAFGEIQILSTGEVQVVVGSATFIDLSHVSFRVN